MRELRQGQWLRVAGDHVVLKGDKELAINGKQKDSVRVETNAVADTTIMSVQNRHPKPLHPLSHQHKEVEVRREKGTSEAEVHLGSSLDSRVETSWKVLARKYLVTVGILPNVIFTSLKRDVNSANVAKSRRRVVTKMAIVKDVRHLGCVLQDTEPPEFSSSLRKGTEVLGPIRRVRFTRATQRHANIRENQGPSLGKNTRQTSSSAQSVRSEIWGQISGGVWKTGAMRLRRRVETCQYAYGQQERPQLCRFGFCRCHSKSDGGCRSQRRGAHKKRGNSVCINRRVDQQKPKAQIKITTKKYGATRCVFCQTGQKSSRKIW